jgi:uncharacterized protein (TIGR02996 family)
VFLTGEALMTPDDAFLHDILAHPDDDAPRLIYADWLDDHGEPERAEYIRVQCELARLPEDHPRHDALHQQQRLLWEAHGPRWLLPFHAAGVNPPEREPHYFQVANFRRGFLEAVSFSGDEFLEHGARLFRMAPIRDLYLHELGDDVRRLAEMPWLRHLTHLDLGYSRCGVALPHAVAAAPHLDGLTHLDVRGNDLNDACMEELARIPHLARLTRLELADNKFTARGVTGVTHTPYLAGLRRLDLSRNRIGTQGVFALMTSPYLKGLTHLDLGETGIDDEGARLLARSPRLQNLRMLDLGYTNIGDAGVAALAGSPYLAGLTDLWLTGLTVSAAGVRALVRSRYLRNLQFLEMTPYEFGARSEASLRRRFGDQALTLYWP